MKKSHNGAVASHTNAKKLNDLSNTTEERSKKLKDIRERIHSGAYRVDSVSLAKILFFWK